jgi:phosphoserine aminotransferase
MILISNKADFGQHRHATGSVDDGACWVISIAAKGRFPMVKRAHNFNPGPAALPLPVLEQVQRELLDWEGSGMSVLEVSHRGGIYERIHNEAIYNLRALFGCREDYAILFMGGGASTQFALVAMNLLPKGSHAEYVTTGYFAEGALREAQKLGDAREIWSSAAARHDHVPAPHEFRVNPQAVYLHYTSNNTIEGTQYPYVPDSGRVPLVCDMSSDVLSRPLDVSRFGLIYAGAQKNIGPAGVTIVIIRKDLLERSPADLPSTFSYRRMAEENSLLNTPPVFAIYMVKLVTEHWLKQGGLEAVGACNAKKAQFLYDAIDNSDGFYRGCARPESRSQMNVTFRLPTQELEQRFVAESAQAGLIGLKGHRSVRGIRASLYNAVGVESVRLLVEFMTDFQKHWS